MARVVYILSFMLEKICFDQFTEIIDSFLSNKGRVA